MPPGIGAAADIPPHAAAYQSGSLVSIVYRLIAMAYVDDQGRPKPPIAGDEVATLVGYLDYLRATVEWKTSGIDSAGLRTKVGPSTMTLGGLLKHLAAVEDSHFNEWLLGEPPPDPWATVDADWPWKTASDDSPDALRRMWREACDRSRRIVAEAIDKGGLDQLGKIVSSRGESPSLRYILMAMIEEYARHAGHADLLREAVDGLKGE